MLFPLLAATLLGAEPSLPPPSPPPLVPTEAASPAEEVPLAPPPPVARQKVRAPRSAKRALTVAGVAVFGGSYGLSLGMAAITELAAAAVPSFPRQTNPYSGLFVPIVGPIIAAAEPRNAFNASFAALMVADTLTQAAGLTFLIVGLAMSETPQPAPTVWFAPTFDAHGAGASFGGSF